MTAACGGGPSQTNPGVASQVVFSATLITGGLAVISPYLLPFAGLVDTFVYNALTQCTGDPPAMPTAAQLSPVNAIGGVLNPNFPSWLTAVNNLLLNWAWTQYCQCVTGTATPPTYPGAPGVSLPGTPTGVACFQGSYNGPSLQDLAAPFPNCSQVLPPGTQGIHGGPPGNTYGTSVPVGVYTSIDSVLSFTFSASGTQDGVMRFVYWDNTGTWISNGPLHTISRVVGGGTASGSFTDTIPSNAAWINCSVGSAPADPAPPTVVMQTAIYCGSSSAGAPAAPCVTDPAVLELLNTLLGLTEAIYQALPVLPNSYSEGTVHSGLTGNGTLTIAATTIAVKVTITTDLPGGRIDIGSPNYLFDRGYIVPIAVEGPIRQFTRLVYSPQLYVLPHLTEQLGYSLPTGEVISITELSRGP